MRKSLLLAAILAFGGAAAHAPAEAEAFCGFYVSGADAKLFNNATQVVLMRDGVRTVLSMQNNYQGPGGDNDRGRPPRRAAAQAEGRPRITNRARRLRSRRAELPARRWRR
jgi:hypothetical protein